VKSIQTSRSDHKRIHEILVRLQRNRNKKQFIEPDLKSLAWLWITFPLATNLIFYNNATSDLESFYVDVQSMRVPKM